MALKIPPVAQTLVAALLILLLAWALPSWRVEIAGRSLAAFLLGLVAAIVIGLAVSGFGAAKTTVDPRYPERATNLVTGGIYMVSRNPMYLGMALLLTAFAVYLGTPAGLVIVAAFILYMNAFQIRPEEAQLRAKFGEAYEAYCARVRRWI